MRINSLAAKTTGAILVFCGGFGCSSSGQIEIDGASLRDVAPFSDIATDLFSHRSDAVLHDGVAEFGATPDGPVVTGEIDSGAPQDGALPFDANPDLVLSDANPDLVLSDAKSDLVLSDAKSDLVSQLSDSMVAKPRHYLATAPVGDLISLELDPLTNQYTYANQSTGDYETGLFSTDPDGYLIFAQSSFLLAGFEAENVAIVLGASHLGPAKDKTAVVFGIPESPIAKADFSNLPQALVYNSIQFRTSTMGGMEVGRVSIGTDGSLSGDIYEPAHNRISAGTVPFVSVVANGPTGAYLVATYPTSSPSDGQVPDGAGSGSPPETPSYVFRNADNTLLFRDGDTGSHLMALEQGNKALLPSNAVTDQQATPSILM